ncbi:hypothetical protein N9D17_00630 [bacterium]|nr:hypothetical protein [bacterium]
MNKDNKEHFHSLNGLGGLSIISVFMGHVSSVFVPRKIIFKILNSKVLNFVGAISYSIYIWQQPFLSDNNYWINSLASSILLLFIISILSYYLIENLFLKLKNFIK